MHDTRPLTDPDSLQRNEGPHDVWAPLTAHNIRLYSTNVRSSMSYQESATEGAALIFFSFFCQLFLNLTEFIGI